MAQHLSPCMLPPLKELASENVHELELGYSGELDLHKHVICKKNPGHTDFIPIRSLEHRQFEETPFGDATEIKKFCQHVANWTVKLKVQRVSSKRSRISNFPLSADAGKRITSFGSGCLTDVDVSGDEGSFPCPLENCPHSTEPHPVYGYINITTAAHVVFDNEEAKETIVEFFDDHPNNKAGVKKAHGYLVKSVNLHEDNCELMCVTHSVSLFQQISQMVSLRPTHPDIFQFADSGENMPTFISLVSALADIRDCSRQGRLNHLCHIFYLVRHEVEKMCTYEKINEVMPDSEEVKTFLLNVEELTKQSGLTEKVLSSLSSKEMICDFTEISFQVIIEKVAVLGAFSLMSKVQKRRLNTFMQYFFSQIVECLNHVTRAFYQNTSNYIDNTIVVHISHPHGQPKQVSLGKYFSSKTKDGQRRHIYTVPTCNGCSGGPVWILPGGHDKKVRWEQVYGVPHGGCFDRVNNLNHSSSQVFGVLQLEKFLDNLNIRPYGHLLKNIEHYQHLLNIGPHQDLPHIKHDLNVLNFILFSHPQWQDPGFNLNQQNLFYDLNQQPNGPLSDLQSVIPEPAQSPFRPESVFRSPSVDSSFSASRSPSVEPSQPTFRNSQSPFVEPLQPISVISPGQSVGLIPPRFGFLKRQSSEPFQPTFKVRRSSAKTVQRRDSAGTLQCDPLPEDDPFSDLYSPVSETAESPFSQNSDLQSPGSAPTILPLSWKSKPQSPVHEPAQSPLSQHLDLQRPYSAPTVLPFHLKLEPQSPVHESDQSLFSQQSEPQSPVSESAHSPLSQPPEPLSPISETAHLPFF